MIALTFLQTCLWLSIPASFKTFQKSRIFWRRIIRKRFTNRMLGRATLFNRSTRSTQKREFRRVTTSWPPRRSSHPCPTSLWRMERSQRVPIVAWSTPSSNRFSSAESRSRTKSFMRTKTNREKTETCLTTTLVLTVKLIRAKNKILLVKSTNSNKSKWINWCKNSKQWAKQNPRRNFKKLVLL